MKRSVILLSILLSGTLRAQSNASMALERDVTVKLTCLGRTIVESSPIRVEMIPEECARYERAGAALEGVGEPDMDHLFLLQTGMAREIYAAHLGAFNRAEELIGSLLPLLETLDRNHPLFALEADRRGLILDLLLDPEGTSKLAGLDEWELAIFGDVRRVYIGIPPQEKPSDLQEQYLVEVETAVYENLVELVGQIRTFCRALNVPEPVPAKKKRSSRKSSPAPTGSPASANSFPMT